VIENDEMEMLWNQEGIACCEVAILAWRWRTEVPLKHLHFYQTWPWEGDNVTASKWTLNLVRGLVIGS